MKSKSRRPRSLIRDPSRTYQPKTQHIAPIFFGASPKSPYKWPKLWITHTKNGVVHRDVKPSNILVDLAGKAWVTDFGLARMENLGNLTMTGDVLGTVRYMSPEQALANRVVIDHRTDVYSLGATLYELLVLQAAFPDKDRRELVRKVAFEDPPTLRRLDRSIPVELETLVLKAMSKNPAERFDTAQDFADDLRRFLEHQPIRAKRPNVVNRMTKWARRHRGIMNSVAVILVLTVIGLAISTFLISREKNKVQMEKQTIIVQRDEANRKLYLAHIRLAKNDWTNGHVGRMAQMLDTHRPKPGQVDLRGWEWWYLNSLRQPESSVLRGHRGRVTCIAYDPLGNKLASGGFDYVVMIWDLENRSQILSLSGHQGHVNSVAWSHDGKQLASASSDRTVIIWDVATGSRIRTIQHTTGVKSVSWSFDGKNLATSGDSSTVKVWDVNTGNLKFDLENDSWIHQVAWRPNQEQLVCLTRNKIWLWDTENKKTLYALEKIRPENKGYVSFSPDGVLLVEGGNQSGTGSFSIWHIDNKQRVHANLNAHTGYIAGSAWCPDGEQFATAGEAGIIHVWNAGTGQVVSTLRGHHGGANAVRWSPDHRQIATAGRDQTIRLWEPGSHQQFQSVNGFGRFAWSPDGQRLAAPWVEPLFGESKQEWMLRFSERSEPKSIAIIDATTGKTLQTLPVQYTGWLSSIAWSPDGKNIAFAAAFDQMTEGRIVVWNLDSMEEVWNEPCLRPSCLAWNADGDRLATGHSGPRHEVTGQRSGAVIVWESSSGRRLRKLNDLSEWVYSIAWNPGGEHIALKTRDERLIVVDANSGREIIEVSANQFTTSGDGQSCIAWSPDGRRVATGDGDGGVTVWQAETGRDVLHFQAHSHAVYCLDWNPDGDRLATGGSDQIVKIWDTKTGDELLAFHEDCIVGSLAWDPTGTKLASSGGPQFQIRIRQAPGFDGSKKSNRESRESKR